MTDSGEITAFIRARLDEEEADAQAASEGPWELAEPSDDYRAGLHAPTGTIANWYALTAEDARHIARQNPAVTLARCAALRELVNWATRDPCDGDNVDSYSWGESRVFETAQRVVLGQIAAIWRDHPYWRKEWEL